MRHRNKFSVFLTIQLAQLLTPTLSQDDAHEYDTKGYCIGYSQSFNGNMSGYVQSDMQFAQQVANDILFYTPETADILPDYLNMELRMRFFVLDYSEGDNQMVAAEMHLDYSPDFT